MLRKEANHCISGLELRRARPVQVIWPSGVVDTLSSVPANSILTLVEGTAH